MVSSAPSFEAAASQQTYLQRDCQTYESYRALMPSMLTAIVTSNLDSEDDLIP
jgi:hypothetical protein